MDTGFIDPNRGLRSGEGRIAGQVSQVSNFGLAAGICPGSRQAR
jgi:hypothetical protein